MNSLGFIETVGLIASIEAADTMVKAANVRLRGKTYVGKGLVTVIIEGDVGAVKVAVEAGVDAVKHLKMKVHSFNVIPSPVEELSIFVDPSFGGDCEKEEEEISAFVSEFVSLPEQEPSILEERNLLKSEIIEEETVEQIPKIVIDSKEKLDKFVEKFSADELSAQLVLLTNKQLKSLIGEIDEEAVKGTGLRKANKKELVSYIEAFYKR